MIRHIATISTLAFLASGTMVALAGPASANNFAVTYVNDDGVDTARARWIDTGNRLCANDVLGDDWTTRASVRKPNGDVAFVWDNDGPNNGPTCREISIGENVAIAIKACRPIGEGVFRCSRYKAGTS